MTECYTNSRYFTYFTYQLVRQSPFNKIVIFNKSYVRWQQALLPTLLASQTLTGLGAFVAWQLVRIWATWYYYHHTIIMTMILTTQLCGMNRVMRVDVVTAPHCHHCGTSGRLLTSAIFTSQHCYRVNTHLC